MPHRIRDGMWEFFLLVLESAPIKLVVGETRHLQKTLMIRGFSGVWCFSANLGKETFLCEGTCDSDSVPKFKLMGKRKQTTLLCNIKNTKAPCPQQTWHTLTSLQLKDGLFQVSDFSIFCWLRQKLVCVNQPTYKAAITMCDFCG